MEDILFAVLDEGLRKIEPLIIRFEREARTLRNLSMHLSSHEKNEFILRINMAKEAFHTSDLELD
jgi:hypothetical protein